MTSLLNPRAAARIKAAFETYTLVARAVATRQRARKLRAKASPARRKLVYERGAIRIITD